ncbi:MAG TPA: sodium:solute symporter family protein [Bosea sp. (in: a-proteobacteria)]|jgi:cation/acetate symporter|uniref:sodium:solute symporter family protein n=1 Tax=Bosea sp. (in: a-proteobacteria) TaxID=1871050 RepID=UPI002DDD20CC|nr:sodium:solute symporter family protein [Bosea sp. (in: a-proteobacteria)]HEV2555027.1 sodium:solute symporter family protein [Bosea sp. (in: a-proteobacteria)]
MSAGAQKGDFTSNLGRVYGVYTGGFVAFVVFIGVLERAGVPNHILGYLFVAFTIGVYAAIGIMSRTMQVDEYYVAGRKVPSFYNGMATAADWMSAASFIGMAGTLYLLGYDGLAFILGWTGGYVLVATLIAPYLRKFGCYTVPDFLAFRFGGNGARIAGIVVLMSCSFTYVVAQIVGTGLIGARLLGMSFEVAVFVGLVGILVCSMLGGMRAVTWTQVAQYIVLIVAYLIPVVILSTQKFGIPIPQLTYGTVLSEIQVREAALGVSAAASHTMPFARYDPLNFFALVLCLMVGTASLPHVLMRYFTTPSVREARNSVAWTLLFIFILYFTAPAYAAFAKLEVFTNVIGKPLGELPGWLYSYGKIGLIQVCGTNAVDLATITAACGKIAGHTGILQLANFTIQADAIVIATPEIAGLPYVVSGLVAAGGLAAALSTADGLLLAIANALSHDVYARMINKNAPVARKLIIARVILIMVALIAAWVASHRPADIVAMVAWAFSLAAAGLFPALVMGIWSKKTTATAAVAGIWAGFLTTLVYLVVSRYFPGFGVNVLGMYSNVNPITGAALVDIAKLKAEQPQIFEQGWVAINHPLASRVGYFNIANISAGLFGMPIGFLTMYIVSKFTTAPNKELQDFIDEIRQPRGAPVMIEK